MRMIVRDAVKSVVISIAMLTFTQGKAIADPASTADSTTDAPKMSRQQAAKKFPLFKSDFETSSTNDAPSNIDAPSIDAPSKLETPSKKSSTKKSATSPDPIMLLKKASTNPGPLPSTPEDNKSDDEKLVESEQEKMMQKERPISADSTAATTTGPGEEKPHYRKKIRSKRTVEKSGAQLESAFSQTANDKGSSTEAAGSTLDSSTSAQDKSSTDTGTFRIPR